MVVGARRRTGRSSATAGSTSAWGGDAEILLAVDADPAGGGRRQLRARPGSRTRPRRAASTTSTTPIREHDAARPACTTGSWSAASAATVDGDLRKRVGSSAGRRRRGRLARHATPYDVAADPGGRAPGHEEPGGYVDVDEHRY